MALSALSNIFVPTKGTEITQNTSVAPHSFESQEDFYVQIDQEVSQLEQKGLISSEDAEFLRGLARPGGQNTISFSSPTSSILLSMLNLANLTNSLIKVELIDIANVRVDKSEELADDMRLNAGIAFGVTVVGAAGSLALGFTADKIFGKPGTTPGAKMNSQNPTDIQTGSWGPITTNSMLSISQAGSDMTKSYGQANQSEIQAELERLQHTLQAFTQLSQQVDSQIQNIEQI